MALTANFDRTAFGVVGTIVGTIAAGFILAGLGGFVVHLIQEPDGIDVSTPARLVSPGQAVITPELGMGASIGAWIPEGDAQDYVINIEPATDEPVFVGIARSTQVERYLEDVPHTVFAEVGDEGRLWQEIEGDATAPPPGDEDFWALSTEGAGPQTLRWNGESGAWNLVVMNASGAMEVDVDASAGVLLGSARSLGMWLLGIGLVCGVLASVLWFLGSSRESRRRWLRLVPGQEVSQG